MKRKPFDAGRTPKKTLKAVFPPFYQVGDIKLHPLNTLSFMALDALGSPLLCGRVKLGFNDVAKALFICSRTADELERLMAYDEPMVRAMCAVWCKGIPPEVVLKSVSLITKLIADALSTYVADRNPK